MYTVINNKFCQLVSFLAMAMFFMALPALAQEPASAQDASNKASAELAVKAETKRELPEPMSFVKAKYAEAQNLNAATKDKERDIKLKALIDSIVDYDALAARTLDEKWTELSLEKQSEFKRLFKELSERRYIDKLGEKRVADDQEIDWDRVVKTKEAAIVSCFIQQKDVETEFEIVLHEGCQSWCVYDVLVDGASLAETYKKKYAKDIDEKGVDGIMDEMRKELAKP